MVLDLRKAGKSTSVIGIDTNSDHIAEAIALGIIDREGSYSDLMDADLVIVAVPVNYLIVAVPEVLDAIGPGTVVMDVGSTKGALCNCVADHARRQNFVATHPISGTEFSGPGAAFHGLFRGKVALICDKEKVSSHAQARVEEVYRTLGSRIIEMDPVEHDRHLAYVSHLSHISSFTLGLTVLDIEQNEKNISMLAGSGFESTVRLAKSSPEMWEPIFMQNAPDLLKALDEYLLHLKDFRELIAGNKGTEMLAMMRRANSITRILEMDQFEK